MAESVTSDGLDGSVVPEAQSTESAASHAVLSGGTLFILAIACGVSVATIYFPQAITLLIAADLHVPAETAALVVTTAQLGYALGLLLLGRWATGCRIVLLSRPC